MPNAAYCQIKGCANRTETGHAHCPACEQAGRPRRGQCVSAGCEQRATYRANKCWDHQIAWGGWEFASPEPEPRPQGAPLVCSFDIICLQCSQRRTAKGTEAQATWTRQHLGACPRCRGPQVVERSDLGGISSPSRGHSVTFDAGRAGRKAGAA